MWLLFSCLLFSCVTTGIDGESVKADNKKLSEIYANLASLYNDQGDYLNALERANKAVQVYNSNPRAYLVRANVYAKIKDFKKAETDYKKAIRLNNNYYEALVNYGSFLCSQQKYEMATYNFNLANNNHLYYNRGLGYYAQAQCFFDQKLYNQAEPLFQESVHYGDTPELVYYYLANIALTYNQLELALKNINQYQGVANEEVLTLKIKILQNLKATNKYNISQLDQYQQQIDALKKQLANGTVVNQTY